MVTTPTISLPQGVRDILPEETLKYGAAEARVLEVFSRFGFRKIITPLLEYVDVLSLGMGGSLKERVLKFIDPATSRVIAIRPDITPQIARVVASRMRDYPLPLKLCYNANVIRYGTARDGKSREVLQAGAEYISKESSPEADSEMITMAIEALKSAGLKNFKIDIGDVSFLSAVLSELDLTDAQRSVIKGAIAIKDYSGLETVLSGLEGKVGAADGRLLLNLTTFYGEQEVLKKASQSTKNGKALRAVENLRQVYGIIASKGFKDSVTIDLGEVRGSDYYTGIIFEGFASGIGKPILSGGRYDNLLGGYGYDCAATGFAFDMEYLVAALEKNP